MKPAPQPSQGKGSKSRIQNLKSYRENYDEIFNKQPLTTPKESEDEDLNSCAACGEYAWDGYICHNCGFKKF